MRRTPDSDYFSLSQSFIHVEELNSQPIDSTESLEMDSRRDRVIPTAVVHENRHPNNHEKHLFVCPRGTAVCTVVLVL